MPSHTIKVTGVSEELLRMLDERVRHRRSLGRSEYIRDLIRRDVVDVESRTLAEILAPIHAETRSMTDTDEELDDFFDEVRDDVYAEKVAKSEQQSQHAAGY